jgi:Domain of unknown function (DU1801)
MPTRSFEQLIEAYSPGVQSLARETREQILDLMGGDAEESIDTSGPYAFYGYAPGYKGLVCSVILSKTGVKLGLSHGAALDDPHKLLEGAGKVHKHIPLKSSADLKRPPVKALVKAAIKRWHASANR